MNVMCRNLKPAVPMGSSLRVISGANFETKTESQYIRGLSQNVRLSCSEWKTMNWLLHDRRL